MVRACGNRVRSSEGNLRRVWRKSEISITDGRGLVDQVNTAGLAAAELSGPELRETLPSSPSVEDGRTEALALAPHRAPGFSSDSE